MSVELVEVIRTGFRECVHRGSMVLLDADGAPEIAHGEVHTPIFPRSTNKPLQGLALLRSGFEPADERELAIAVSSHHGQVEHVRLVQRLLDRFGLREDQLCCPPELPSDELARARAVQHGAGERRLTMNCSGKHAAMLATCLVNGWPTDGYLEPGHPVQQAVLATVAEITGEPAARLGIDGCGAPIVPVSLARLALAFARLTAAGPGTPERRIVDAMRAQPFVISGTDADDLLLMSAVPGLVCKAGADGVHAGALPDGRAFAFKIDDGAERARLPLAAAILQRLSGVATDDLAELAARPVLGGGVRVGAVRAVAGLF